MAKNTGEESHRDLGRLPLFAEINPEARADLAAMCRRRTCPAGQTLVHEGETLDFVGCVISGIVRMQKTLPDGRQHIVGLLVEGDMFGRMFGGASQFAKEAATDVEYCAFPRAQFEALLERSPDLDRAVLLNILHELDRARDWVMILSNQRIAGRLAGFLLLMCSRYRDIDHILRAGADGLEVKIPINRVDLAHILGTRPESISRALHALSDQGDIEMLGPNRIRLRNVEALAKAADEDEVRIIATMKDILNRKRRTR